MTAALVGIGSGALHAISGPDHLLCLAPHALARRRGAWRVGAAWGAGHAAGTVAVTSLLLAAAEAAHLSVVERWAERGAGVALVAVGLLGLLALRRTPDPAGPPGGGLVAALAVGLVHGALGAVALVALVAGIAAPGVERVLFLAGFSAGSSAAMALLTEALVRATRAPRLAALLPRVPPLAAAASIVLGLGWMALA